MPEWFLSLEIIHAIPAARARIAVFDFDGSLSLIRAGWFPLMKRMMVEGLTALGTGESEADLAAEVEDYIWRFTGQDTICQMIAFTEAIRRRGGRPLDAAVYKQRFLDRLYRVTNLRMEEIRGGGPPDRHLVPGTRRLLETLRARGMRLYLASGTDEPALLEEAALLDIARYFEGIHGARDNSGGFTKRALLERLIAQPGMEGERLVGFGDGPVETEEIKRAGGIAVGLATDEPECRVVNEWKRARLIASGADYIVPHYGCHDELMEVLFDGRR